MINQVCPAAYISIHANSAGNQAAHGIETYCLHHQLFKPYCGPHDHWRYVQHICRKSSDLADCVHRQVLENVRAYAVRDRSVKQAVTQLLLGTDRPGILIELGFITHPNEAKLLGTSSYQRTLAEGICDGICRFISS